MHHLLTDQDTVEIVSSAKTHSTVSDQAPRIPLVYIASPSFSGSTLLTFLLNTHPAVATVGELKWGNIDIETYRCSCRRFLRECPFWNEVNSAVHRRGLPFDLHRPPTDFRFPSWPIVDRFARARIRNKPFETLRQFVLQSSLPVRSAWKTIQQVNVTVIQTAIRLKGATMFLDASKDPVRLKHLLDSPQYDIYILQLIRDGRAVTYSARKNKSQTAAHAALEWRNTHKQIERLSNIVSVERFLSVHYEDLCRRPQFVLRGMFDFLKLDPDVAASDPNDVPHHILGNKMRLKPIASVQLNETWRESLSPDDHRAFERIAGALNREYGYE